MGEKLRKIKYVFILVVLSFLVYFNSLQGQFVSDDIEGIVNSKDVEQIVIHNFHSIILGNLHRVFHANPLPYHINSIIFNAITCILIFWLLCKFFNTIPAFLGSLFFVVHPLHTEATSWISGNGYIYYCFLYLLIILLYEQNYFWYFISILLYAWFCIGMFPWLLLVPLLVLAYELSLGRNYKRLLLFLPYFVIAVIVFLSKMNMVVSRVNEVQANNKYFSGLLTNPILLGIHSIFSNLYNLFIPYQLTLYHEPMMVSNAQFIKEAIIVAIIILSLPILFKKSKPLFMGLSFFLIGISPCLSPKPVAFLVADRYMYLSVILLSCIIGFIYTKLAHRLGNWILVIICFLFLGYAFRTVARNEDYRSQRRYWEATVIHSPLSPRSHNELGRVFFAEGNIGAAIREFQTCVALVPSYAVGWNNLAVSYQFIKDYNNAVNCYEQAIKFSPTIFDANFNVGVIYLNSDMFDKAVVRLTQAHSLLPDRKDVVKALDLAQRGLKGEKLPEMNKK